MFKRVRWIGMGAVAGAGASMWAQYRLRRTMEEHPGVKLSAQAASKARKWGLEVRDSLHEGRAAMAERESSLQAELDERLVPLRSDPAAAGETPAEPPHLHVVDARSEPLPAPRGALAPPRTGKPGGGRTRRRLWAPKQA